METLKLKYAPAKFNQLSSANSFCERCIKMHMVMLGDDDKFWVVCFADAQRLFKAGYEIA